METMRERFENLTQIKNILEYNESDNVVFDEENQEYKAELYTKFVPEYIEWINGAWYAFQEQEKKIDAVKKMIVSLRNEFDLWSDDTESFDAIEAQIENLEDLFNESQKE